MKRGNMSLETIGKVLLVLAVVIVLLFVFRSLIGKGAGNLGDVNEDVGTETKRCILKPNDPTCQSIFDSGDDSGDGAQGNDGDSSASTD